MRFFITCPQCGDPGQKIEVRLQNFGRARGSCARGHSIAIVLMHPKFDLLAEIATQAILDGYYRDAVASFSASLERFYEFYFRVICRKNSISLAAIEQSWKRVKRQSERQLGLFIATFLNENGAPPQLLSESDAAFRNAVVHQGEIPTEAEAIKFGQAVIDISYPAARALFHDFHEEVHAEQRSEGNVNWDFAEPGDTNMSAAGGMIFNLAMTAPPTFDLRENLEYRRSQRSE